MLLTDATDYPRYYHSNVSDYVWRVLHPNAHVQWLSHPTGQWLTTYMFEDSLTAASWRLPVSLEQLHALAVEGKLCCGAGGIPHTQLIDIFQRLLYEARK